LDLKSKSIKIFDNEWDTGKLEDVCELITDGSHFSPKEDSQGTMIIATVKDMLYDEFNFERCKKISKKSFEELVRTGCSPQNQDILVSKDGANCLDIIFVYDSSKKIVLLSSIAILRIKNNHNPWFFRYYLLYSKTQEIMKNGFVSGSAIPRVILKNFKNVPIVIPPIETQDQIANTFQTLDQKIKNLQNQNRTLEQMAQAIFKSWFVDFDGVTEFEDSELGKIPKGWEIKKLIDKILVTYGFPFKSKLFNLKQGTPVIRIRNLDHSFSDTLTTEVCEKKYHIFSGDILLGMDGEFNTSAWLGEESLLNQRVCKLSTKNKTISNLLIMFLVKQKFKEYEQKISGTTVIHLSKQDVEELKIIFPSNEFLKKYNNLSELILQKLIKNKKSIFSLTKTRDILLPKLMSGEIRV
jgi:type I restriction enzyme, S subunit